jgi:hypothetical protein
MYAIGTIVPARDQPSGSFGPTNSSVPTSTASPIGNPSQPSHAGSTVVVTIEAATVSVQSPVNR